MNVNITVYGIRFIIQQLIMIQFVDVHCSLNTQGDSDVISFHIYASCFSPPSCG